MNVVPRVLYRPGNMVWVYLLNRIWRLGKVVRIDDIPCTLSETLNTKKMIIAIVHFARDDF